MLTDHHQTAVDHYHGCIRVRRPRDAKHPGSDWVEAKLWLPDGCYERIAHWKGDTRCPPWVGANDPTLFKEAS